MCKQTHKVPCNVMSISAHPAHTKDTHTATTTATTGLHSEHVGGKSGPKFRDVPPYLWKRQRVIAVALLRHEQWPLCDRWRLKFVLCMKRNHVDRK